MLAAKGVFGGEELRRTALLGELGLDGRLRLVRGILPATLAAQQAGFTRVIVPLRQAGEAQPVEGSRSLVLPRSPQLVAFLQGIPMPPVEPIEVIGAANNCWQPRPSGAGHCQTETSGPAGGLYRADVWLTRHDARIVMTGYPHLFEPAPGSQNADIIDSLPGGWLDKTSRIAASS